MLVRLNEPASVANGNIQLLSVIHCIVSQNMFTLPKKNSYNDMQAIDQQNLQIRNSDSLSANGFYFS